MKDFNSKKSHNAMGKKFSKTEREDRADRAERMQRMSARYQISDDIVIDYKNVPVLQKFINDRGKIVPRRISGLTAKNQRLLNTAIKKARFLGLLSVGSSKR
ncbi:MAG TPA: 30S ribosomal protein S18 [Candidatus Omnitrophota bacterium]|nr:30S ribosomal protein S18 [Candidatus Omnitrophota bacterium]